MAVTFKILVHQNDDNLHLRLEGDFDSSAAEELLQALQQRCRFASRAFIHTNGLRHIDPFGRSVFRDHLASEKGGRTCWPLDFTGDHAEELAPEGSKLH
jgi:anti-anti-sigma regulatory factor